MPTVLLIVLAVIACLAVGSVIFAVAGFLIYRKVSGFIAARREKELLQISDYRNRLCHVVSELIVRVNEIDQGSEYIPELKSSEWSAAVGAHCRELLAIDDSLKVARGLIEAKSVNQSRETILIAIRDTVRIHRQVNSMEKRLLAYSPSQPLGSMGQNSTIAGGVERSSNEKEESPEVERGNAADDDGAKG